MEEWLAIVRRALEAGDDMQVMDQFRMDLYEDEVFVFTPKGEIKKFPMGATVLDFAYLIHSRIGNQCVGARINGRNVQIREELHSGDTVEILTSAQQKPKRDWLQIVKTSHAKSKIRQAIKEAQAADGLYAREVLYRRFKNRKIEVDEPLLQQLIKKMGYKEVSDFYIAIANEQLDVLTVIDRYMELKNPQVSAGDDGEGAPRKSASEYVMKERRDDDVLVIDRNLKGVDYTLAKCCNPIYGDDVFGFVTVSGGIRIHRQDCPNAPEMRSRYGYRIVKARWSEKGSGRYDITMQVIGNDDIDIVNNITSVISKEENTALRSINIDSDDGLFKGVITVALDDTSRLEALIRKLQNIKGVKSVKRM